MLFYSKYHSVFFILWQYPGRSSLGYLSICQRLGIADPSKIFCSTAHSSGCWVRRVTAGSLVCHPHSYLATTQHSVANTGRGVWLLLKVWGSTRRCLPMFMWGLGWAVSVLEERRSCLTPGYGRSDATRESSCWVLSEETEFTVKKENPDKRRKKCI